MVWTMKKKLWIVISAFAALLIAGVAIVLFATGTIGLGKSTFASQTDCEMFQEIPILVGENVTFSEARDVGSENYMIEADGTSLEEYKAYLQKLEDNGFKKHVDNGENGNDGAVYSAYYKNGEQMLHICHMSKIQRTTINAWKGDDLTENLIYNEAFIADNIEGMKTTFHVPELYNVGNSFIFQLKNGHFIINDGGTEAELPYLLDYLEKLAPNGEKPIVDLWVVSHAHTDHMGVINKIYDSKKDIDRIFVEKVMYNAPNAESLKTPAGMFDPVGPLVTIVNATSAFFKSTDGNGPEVFRPRMGDKYYFNDITIDVIYSQELIDSNEWKTWNSSTTVLMYNIEGQKVLITGDADINCQKFYMDLFDSSYFKLDVYQVAHHGKNLFNAFTNHCSEIGTLVYPTYTIGSASPQGDFASRAVQNEYLRSKAKEALNYANGTIVLTFPYEVGSVKTLPDQEWIYNSTPPKWKSVINK